VGDRDASYRDVMRPVIDATGCRNIGRAATQAAAATIITPRNTISPHQLPLP
jgi:hypothetical protein